MSISVLKSQINLDCPDELDVLRAIYFEAGSTTPRGFLDVFTEDEVLQMWGSDNLKHWSKPNKDWLVNTAADIIDKHLEDNK